MGINSICRGVLSGFLVCLLFVGTFCQADDKSFEVVGEGECADCQEKNIQTDHAFLGLRVSIDCKDKDGKFKCKGEGELDGVGKFRVTLNEKILDNGDDKEECYAQLHSAFSAPCPAHDGLEATKIVAKFYPDGKFSFEPVTKLKFSTSLCSSATLWPYYKFPPSPEIDSWKKHCHHLKFPPFSKKPAPPSEPKKPEPEPKKPEPPSEPKKPEPEPKKPEPEPKKPEPQPKKSKPSAPKKSEAKKQKPQAPKKLLPPSEPKKPEPPVTKPPSEKPPVSKKPCPDIPKIPKLQVFPSFLQRNITTQNFHAFLYHLIFLCHEFYLLEQVGCLTFYV